MARLLTGGARFRSLAQFREQSWLWCKRRDIEEAVETGYFEGVEDELRVLLAATHVGARQADIAALLCLPVDVVRPIAQRYRASRIFVGARVRGDAEWNGEHPQLALLLDAMVGAGMLVKTWPLISGKE